MHIPPDAASTDILKPDSLVGELWRRLAPDRWPVPLHALPEGTALVGGAVRDGLLGRLAERPDLDLVVPSDALALTRDLGKRLAGTVIVLDEKRDMARLVIHGWTIDVARQDGASLELDLQRRDYSINAMALPLRPEGGLMDPTGGLEDLKRRRLVAVRESNLTDDPLRLLRGPRLMAEIALTLDEQTGRWIERHRHQLSHAAPERILSELQRLVAGPEADAVMPRLRQLRLLDPWQAEPGSVATPREQNADALLAEERQRSLPLARLTHLISDLGLEQLRASRQLRNRCQRLRRWIQQLPDDPERLGERERFDLHQELEDDWPALSLYLSATHRRQWLKRWRDPNDPLFHPKAPVDGAVLQQELGLRPGPVIGRLLDHLTRERAFQRVGDRASALAEAKRWYDLQSDLL